MCHLAVTAEKCSHDINKTIAAAIYNSAVFEKVLINRYSTSIFVIPVKLIDYVYQNTGYCSCNLDVIWLDKYIIFFLKYQSNTLYSLDIAKKISL